MKTFFPAKRKVGDWGTNSWQRILHGIVMPPVALCPANGNFEARSGVLILGRLWCGGSPETPGSADAVRVSRAWSAGGDGIADGRRYTAGRVAGASKDSICSAYVRNRRGGIDAATGLAAEKSGWRWVGWGFLAADHGAENILWEELEWETNFLREHATNRGRRATKFQGTNQNMRIFDLAEACRVG